MVKKYGESIANSDYEWLLDPIDGTINFANGIPLYSTSIALDKSNETINWVVGEKKRLSCTLADKKIFI